MKKTGKYFTILLFSLFLLLPTAANAADYKNAEAFFKDGLRAPVIKDCYVFVSDSISKNGYSSYVDYAKKAWSLIPLADVNYWSAGSATNADIRVYVGNIGLDFAGEAQPYIGGKKVTVEKKQDWDYVSITINKVYIDEHNLTDLMIKKTFVHEFGHALSLKHQPANYNSVMMNGHTNFSLPQDLDKNNIAWKY